MIKTFLAVSIAALTLSACSDSSSTAGGADYKAEIRARKAENASIWQTRQSIAFGGKSFEVAVPDHRSFAFIAPASSGFSYTTVELEAAARSATGCQAKYAAGILSALGGYSETVDLREIQGKVKNFKYWRTDLTC